jgi:hypothetical protein
LGFAAGYIFMVLLGKIVFPIADYLSEYITVPEGEQRKVSVFFTSSLVFPEPVFVNLLRSPEFDS